MGLIKKPNILLLDEPSLGLAPNLVTDFFYNLKRINDETKTTIRIVEHKVREILNISNWIIGLRRGKIIEQGAPNMFNMELLRNLFLL